MNSQQFETLLSQHPNLYDHSLLAILFDQADFAHWAEKFEIKDYSKEQFIFQAGDQPDGLYLVLEGKAHLFSGDLQKDGSQGVVAPYRTCSTYSSLRGYPHPYSAAFEDGGKALYIPMSVLQIIAQQSQEALEYISRVSGNLELRMMAKSLDEIGCSRQFKIQFITSLKEQSVRPHEIIANHGEFTEQAFFITEGQVIFEKKAPDGKKRSQWVAPIRSWHLWQQCLEQKSLTFNVKAVFESKIILIEQQTLADLKKSFPKDVQLLTDLILKGINAAHELEETDEEDVDLSALFENTKSPDLPFWKSYPWVMQADQMDCGPACMSMISRSYGKSTTLQFWRHKLSTDRSGTSLYDLAVTGEKHGFITAAIAVEDIIEIDKAWLPCIALRKNHFVVVYEIHKTYVVLGDPAVGIHKQSIDEFNESFEESALLLKPNDSFNLLPEQKFRFRHFLALVSDMKMELSISFFISFLMILLGLGAPLITQIFLDDVLVRRDMTWMWLIFGAGVALVMIESFLSWSKVYYLNHLSNKVEFRLNTILMKKILRLPYKYHAEKHVGDFTTRFQDLNRIKQFLLHTGEDVILSLISVVVYSAILFSYAPSVAIAAFAALPVYGLLSWGAAKRLVQIDQEIFKKNAEVETSLTDTFKGISAIKAFGGELASRWRFEEKFIDLLKLERKYEMNAESIQVVFELYLTIVKYGITGLCMVLAIQGNLSAGQVLATTMIASSLFAPLVGLTSKIGQIQHVVSVVDRINDILMEPDEFEDKKGQLQPSNFRGEIEFRDVWFRYGSESSDWVLKGINFKLEPGQHLAVIGPSGSGKSTIASLINRMLVPTKGQIFIDGRNYLDYDIDWLREKIGILQQDTPLFAGSLMENIAFSKPEFDLEDVVRAAEEANAHDFIESKPRGYHYVLSASGSGLSGGEKQRIALSRTFFKKPGVLILDEATSALDGLAEAQLIDKIRTNPAKMTTINIAHRFSTAISSDLVMVIAQGKVVGLGSHGDMAQNNSVYQDLFRDYLDHPKLRLAKREAA